MKPLNQIEPYIYPEDIKISKHVPKIRDKYKIITSYAYENDNFGNKEHYFSTKYDALKFIFYIKQVCAINDEWAEEIEFNYAGYNCDLYDEYLLSIKDTYPEVYRELGRIPVDHANGLYYPEIEEVFYYDKNGEKFKCNIEWEGT